MQLTFPMPHLAELKGMTQPWEYAVTGPDQLRMAKCAEDLGYDLIGIPEHLAVPPAHIENTGSFWFHSIAAMAAIAGATSKIRLNSCVTILPFQHPIVMAKALVTADWMSGGRITVTFGLGSIEQEYDYLGVPFRGRGARADEYLEAIIALWTQERPSFRGRHVQFDNVGFDPKPVQEPHIPIWIGGDSDAALRRAARFGSGWIISYRTDPEDIPARIGLIKSRPEWRERRFDVMYGLGTSRLTLNHVPREDPAAQPGMSAQEIVDTLNRYGELGVTVSSVPIPDVADCDAYLDYAQWVMEEVKPHI